jgi:hypothetical protein
MDEPAFWSLIAVAAREDGGFDEKVDALEARLRELPPEEIEAFYLRYDEHVTAAWKPELVPVAYLANHHLELGGCGRCDAEDFLAFVCWLVDQGREVYAAALRDPDDLAGHADDPPWQSDGLWVAAATAWEGRRGGSFYDVVRGRASGPQELPDGGPVEDRELARRFPSLSADSSGRWAEGQDGPAEPDGGSKPRRSQRH